MEILTPLSQLDQFPIKQLLQYGSQTTVYSLENRSDLFPQPQLAAKIVESFNYASKEMLQKEYEILKRLDHENIIKAYDLIQNGNLELTYTNKLKDQSQIVDYILLEQCCKTSLFDIIIKEGRCSVNLSCYIFKQLIQAVKYCHQQDIFHRDIKPENILFSYDDLKVKLIDFNLSDRGVQKGKRAYKGTMCYMAPEILQRQEYFGTHVDVFNCGVVFFILLTGFRPFQCASGRDIYYN